MENLIRHIDYLMSRNDCVIIPGVGALLARRVSAYIDMDRGIAYPPHREFSFNSALVYNDGVLAHSYSRALGITYDNALAKVNEAVGKLEAALHADIHVKLGHTGTLALIDGALDFTPAHDPVLSYLPEYERKAKPTAMIPVDNEYPANALASSRFSWGLRQAVRVAASIALLIGICFIASTPIKVDDAALASLSPEFRQATIEDIMTVDQDEPDDVYMINAYASTADLLYVDASLRQVKANAAAKKYYLIVASFHSASEANKFIEMHPEQNLCILEGISTCRVSAGAYDKANDAIKALNATAFRSTGAWISHQ